ncbi:Ca-activated chloride channel family protein [Catalinimonas alkaloidigena]|uniref:vWA domain-containing protein n=1 Tax=Catalinimonas alkaloidigena TaxID=1075417 RepID=UPI002404FBCF|nr:VWA domain-containing protein [Catalinimonas alkaloidigena]MDF9796691.1 Ca-activated chloride channel family protein [Catalinimonas alkaloidigena]
MKRYILLLFFLTSVGLVRAQVQIQRPPEKTRLLFLLDASGSMYANWENSVRMDIAKAMLVELVDSLKVDQDLELALRVYGHQYNLRYKNCQDSKLEVPFAPANHDRLIAKLRQIQPSGVTPIAYSLEQAANDFTNDPEYRNLIIIITDGIESCGGDPCAVSLSLQEKNIFLKPFVIGLGMDNDYRDEFACVGQYFDAKNVNDFRLVLDDILKQSLETTTVSVELLGTDNQPTETNVNVTFYNNFTKAPIYDFVHYRDAQGRPDSVVLDAVLSYDVVVNTIPPVIKRNVIFEGGKHNVLPIKSPQGSLQLSQRGHTEYDKGVNALIRQHGKQEILNVQSVASAEKYLAGTYDIEVLTLPKTYFKDVKIEYGQTTNLTIPGPGVLNANIVTKGYGSIYKVHENGFQEWVYDLNADETRFTMALQPGNYKMVFRAERSFGSKYTEVKEFKIDSGSTVSVKFFGP